MLALFWYLVLTNEEIILDHVELARFFADAQLLKLIHEGILLKNVDALRVFSDAVAITTEGVSKLLISKSAGLRVELRVGTSSVHTKVRELLKSTLPASQLTLVVQAPELADAHGVGGANASQRVALKHTPTSTNV